MESYNSNNDKPKISLNRKKRMWNRYRNYIAGLAVLVVAVIIVAIVLKSCSNKNSGRQDDTKVTTSPVQQESTAPVIQESKEPNRADNSSCFRQDFICFRYTGDSGLYIFIGIQQGCIYW